MASLIFSNRCAQIAKHFEMSRGKNSGIIVELPDGRLGCIYHKDRNQLINGKLICHTSEKPTVQGDIFATDEAVQQIRAAPKKILIDPATKVKHIGFFD